MPGKSRLKTLELDRGGGQGNKRWGWGQERRIQLRGGLKMSSWPFQRRFISTSQHFTLFIFFFFSRTFSFFALHNCTLSCPFYCLSNYCSVSFPASSTLAKCWPSGCNLLPLSLSLQTHLSNSRSPVGFSFSILLAQWVLLSGDTQGLKNKHFP